MRITNKEYIIKLREYGFPLWAICKSLELTNNNYDDTFAKLKGIYCVIGDNPGATIKQKEDAIRVQN